MKKIISTAIAVMFVQGCSNTVNDLSMMVPQNEVQVSSVTSEHHPDFARKLKNRAKYTVKSKLTTNSICGKDDLQHVNFYDGTLGETKEFVQTHKTSVGALESSNTDNSSKFCTGTLISENLFLTAAHCVDGSASKKFVSFNYEKAKEGGLLKQKHFKVLELVEDGLNNLDYAILKLEGTPGKEFGFKKVNPVSPEKKSKLSIIQHPSGEPKQFEAGTVDGYAGTYMGYGDIDTEPGSSGSGVLNENAEVVAVHTNGGCGSSSGTNKGVMMSEIFKASETLKKLASTAKNRR